MADPRFFNRLGPFTLQELAERIGATLSDSKAGSTLISDVAPLDTAGEGELSFLDNRKYISQFTTTKATACVVSPDLAKQAPAGTTCLITPMPYKAYALAAQAFYPPHPTITEAWQSPAAMIDDSAEIGDNCRIEAGVVIAAKVKIGPGCHIRANAVIGQSVEIGTGCIIGANSTISHTLIGNRVVIYPGAQIGQRGFGFAIDPSQGFFTVPQLGRVIIEDDVEVGAGTTIDRGAGPDTVIGQGTRIDNLVQIGHNVRIGRYCVIVAQTGLAGSTKLEDFVMMGGQTATSGHLTIGSGAKVAGQSGIMRDVEAGAEMMGYPAVPIKQFFRQIAALNKLTQKRKK